jgi:hypothetical protein
VLKKGLWGFCILLAVLVGLFPVSFFIEEKFGLLTLKPDALLADKVWRIGFYTHIVSGGLALLVGWLPFIRRIRNNHLAVHRNVGKFYVLSALTASATGVFLGFYATGGLVAAAGFVSLGATWFYATLAAYLHIRNKRVNRHETMMTYSYALCFAAVTLRTWLPLSALLGIEFITAYKFIAWFCWIPNLSVAYLLTRRRNVLQTVVAT